MMVVTTFFDIWVKMIVVLFAVVCGILIGKYNPYVFMKSKVSSDKIRESPRDVPNHIAVIMDGNRRFGKLKHSDPLQGHWMGGQTLVDFVQWCMEDKIKILTVYAFSTENWNRDEHEITTLMMIISKYAESFKQEAMTRNVKVNILATDLFKLPNHVQESIYELEQSTKFNTGFQVNICLSYGGRADILQACRKVTSDVVDHKICAEDITEQYFSNKLTTSGFADPDIMIRTSGEYRISNFLIWQLAYTELFFVDKFWPEITQSDLRDILHQYCGRNRRFGL